MRPTLLLRAANTPQQQSINHFQRAQSGLFHGKLIQFGNNVPHSKHKTRRTWLPNIRPKRLQSQLLNETVKFQVTTRALRTIKKYGGIDKYLLNVRTKFLGETAMKMRIKLRDAERRERFQSIMQGIIDKQNPKVCLLVVYTRETRSYGSMQKKIVSNGPTSTSAETKAVEVDTSSKGTSTPTNGPPSKPSKSTSTSSTSASTPETASSTDVMLDSLKVRFWFHCSLFAHISVLQAFLPDASTSPSPTQTPPKYRVPTPPPPTEEPIVLPTNKKLALKMLARRRSSLVTLKVQKKD